MFESRTLGLMLIYRVFTHSMVNTCLSFAGAEHQPRRKHVARFPVMARGYGCLPLFPHHARVSCQPSWSSSTIYGHGGRMRTVARHTTLTWLWLRWRSAMPIVTVTTVRVSACMVENRACVGMV
jgi:hypothetical protein